MTPLLFLTARLSLGDPASADSPYDPAYTINGAVVTEYDIDQRVLLLEALGASGDVRAEAVAQLTEDRLKVQSGEVIGLILPEDAIEIGLEEFATTRGITVDDVFQVMAARDIDRQTMDDFVLAGLTWREVISARFRDRATPSEEEIDAALAIEESTPIEVYQLAEIALPFAERGEDETLELANQLYRELQRGASFTALAQRYSRSASVERDGLIDPMPVNTMPPAIRSQVLVLRPGQVTRPIPISGGVALLRVVSVGQERPDTSPETEPARREALRNRLFNERITAFGQGYLQELLADALIIEP